VKEGFWLRFIDFHLFFFALLTMSSLFDLRLVFICFFLYFFLLCLPPVGYQYQCNTWGAVMSQNLTVSGSHVVGQVYMYCNWKQIVCGLPDAVWRQYIDTFKSFGIDKSLYESSRSRLTVSSDARQNGIDTIETKCHPMY